MVKELSLPDGSGVLNDLRVSPDGKYAVVSHLLPRFRLPATQLDRGWMNSNAATIIDLARMEIVNTVLLDNIDRGAADPWGVAWSADSATLVITHAGTHEISVIDFPAVLAKLAKVPAMLDPSKPADPISASRVQADVPNDLAFLVGVRQRIKLPQNDLGPRAVVLLGRKAYVANYFSDSLSLVDLASPQPRPQSIPLLLQPAGAGAKEARLSPRPHAPHPQRGVLLQRRRHLLPGLAKLRDLPSRQAAWTGSTGTCSTTASATPRTPRACCWRTRLRPP